MLTTSSTPSTTTSTSSTTTTTESITTDEDTTVDTTIDTTGSPTELPTELPTESPTELPTESPTNLLPTTSTTTQPIPEFECPFDGIHPHPFECTEYFICAGNVPHLMRCADELHFNAATLQCDFKENAECDLYSNFI